VDHRISSRSGSSWQERSQSRGARPTGSRQTRGPSTSPCLGRRVVPICDSAVPCQLPGLQLSPRGAAVARLTGDRLLGLSLVPARQRGLGHWWNLRGNDRIRGWGALSRRPPDGGERRTRALPRGCERPDADRPDSRVGRKGALWARAGRNICFSGPNRSCAWAFRENEALGTRRASHILNRRILRVSSDRKPLCRRFESASRHPPDWPRFVWADGPHSSAQIPRHLRVSAGISAGRAARRYHRGSAKCQQTRAFLLASA